MWQRELDYRLIKEVWAFRENRIAVRFAYEWRDDSGSWFRSYGNENWEIRRAWLDAVAHRQHQRSSDRGERPQITIGRSADARMVILLERSRPLTRLRQCIARRWRRGRRR
jgi:hypothetical protein